jgi:predicted site-specific integrase-resolvase
MTKALPYPPPWQDSVTLAAHISVSVSTLENWVTAGIIPPPRKRGGKLMWKWDEVDKQIGRQQWRPE